MGEAKRRKKEARFFDSSRVKAILKLMNGDDYEQHCPPGITLHKRITGQLYPYQDGLMVGCSSWLLAGGHVVEKRKGYSVMMRELPSAYFAEGSVAYHAFKESWSDKKIAFHLLDHNCATNRREVIDAIDMWVEDKL